jgi:hypothetical protein
MGMLLRHRPSDSENITTAECFGRPENAKPVEKTAESTKDEKPKTVKRGRPTKQ